VFVALALLPSGSSFANAIPAVVSLDHSTSGSISFGSGSVTFSGISGPALFEGSLGTYSLGNDTVKVPQPDPILFTVAVSSASLAGSLTLDFMQTHGQHTFFEGTYTVTSSTSGFSNAGFSVGAVADLNFVTDNGSGVIMLSDGEIDPPVPVPEPGTIALVGSGLLVAAVLMRRKS